MAVAIVQKARGGGAVGATFPSPVTVGNILIGVVMTRDSYNPLPMAYTGTSTVDPSWTTIGQVFGGGGTWIGGKVATTTGQTFNSQAYGLSKSDILTVYELSGLAGVGGADITTLAYVGTTSTRSWDSGNINVPSGGIALGHIMWYPDGPHSASLFNPPTGWTEDYDTQFLSVYSWAGHVLGSGADVSTAWSVDANGYNMRGSNAIYAVLAEAPPVIPPSANFVGVPTQGNNPLSVEFTDLSSGDPTSWSWSFGDGETSTESNPTHVYTSAGNNTVSLTVTNDDGNDTATKQEYITVLRTPIVPQARDRLLLSVRASYNDENLFNHALVIATGNKAQIFYGEASDTDSDSPTRIEAIGDRVFKLETDLITTQVTANKAALKAFLDNCLVNEDIALEAICNPALEGNDVIGVEELTFSQIQRNFRLQSFTIPLSSSRQNLKLARVINLQTQTISVNPDIILVGYEQTIKTTQVTSATVAVPAGVTDGDLMLMWVALDTSSPLSDTNPISSGFTSVSGSNKWKYRIASGAESTKTVTWSGARRAIITLMVYRNVDQSDPIAGLAGWHKTGKVFSGPNLTLPSGEYHLVAGVVGDGGGVTYEWDTEHWTEMVESDTGGTGKAHVSTSIADRPRVGANPPMFGVEASADVGEFVYQLALRKDIS